MIPKFILLTEPFIGLHFFELEDGIFSIPLEFAEKLGCCIEQSFFKRPIKGWLRDHERAHDELVVHDEIVISEGGSSSKEVFGVEDKPGGPARGYPTKKAEENPIEVPCKKIQTPELGLGRSRLDPFLELEFLEKTHFIVDQGL